MQNTDCLPCCDFPRAREVTLLGERVRVKNYICACNGGKYRMKPEKVKLQVSILLTRYCDAYCPFCIAAPTTDETALTPEKLEKALRALKAEDCVRGFSITGGEPFTRPSLLDRTVSMIFDVFGEETEVSLNTNGFRLDELQGIRALRHVDAVHISRHHWEDGKNSSFFGREMPTGVQLKAWIEAIGWKDLFVLNCMLLKGGVETPEHARRYLEWAIGTGAGKVSFITGTAVNSYVRQRRVRFDDVLRDGDPGVLFTRQYQDFDWCRCRDGVYVSPGGKLIEFYGRQTEPDGCDYCRGLVLTPEGRLTAGFGGETLWQA